MRQVYRIDDDGYYIEPVVINDDLVPESCVALMPTEGLFRARYVDGVWVEGLSQSEIDNIVNKPTSPTEIELLKKQQADLTFTLMMNGVI